MRFTIYRSEIRHLNRYRSSLNGRGWSRPALGCFRWFWACGGWPGWGPVACGGQDIQFTLDGQLIVVLTSAGTIRRLSLPDGRKRLFTDEMGAITAFALASTGDQILIGDATGMLRLRGLPGGDIVRELRAHGGGIDAVALSPDGRYAATHGATHPGANRFGGSYDDNEIKVWPLDADRHAFSLPGRSRGGQLDFSADGRTLFVSGPLFVGAWDVGRGKLRYSFHGRGGHMGGDMVVAFSSDGRLAAAPDHNALRLWATDTGTTRQILKMPETPSAFVLSADGSFAVTGGVDRQIRVWDVRSGRCLRTLEGHQTMVHGRRSAGTAPCSRPPTWAQPCWPGNWPGTSTSHPTPPPDRSPGPPADL